MGRSPGWSDPSDREHLDGFKSCVRKGVGPGGPTGVPKKLGGGVDGGRLRADLFFSLFLSPKFFFFTNFLQARSLTGKESQTVFLVFFTFFFFHSSSI